MNQWNAYDREKERLVEPVHDELQYCGRIDDENPDAPVFTMPASFVRMAFTGSSYVKAVVVNKRYYHRSFLGVLLDDTQSRLEIERDGEPVVLTLAENLDKAQKVEYVPCTESLYSVGYTLADTASRFFSESGTGVLGTEYSDEVTFRIAVKSQWLESFEASLLNRLNGRVTIKRLKEYDFPFKI